MTIYVHRKSGGRAIFEDGTVIRFGVPDPPVRRTAGISISQMSSCSTHLYAPLFFDFSSTPKHSVGWMVHLCKVFGPKIQARCSPRIVLLCWVSSSLGSWKKLIDGSRSLFGKSRSWMMKAAQLIGLVMIQGTGVTALKSKSHIFPSTKVRSCFPTFRCRKTSVGTRKMAAPATYTGIARSK